MRSTFLSGRIALGLALAAAAFVAPTRAADDDYWGLEPGKVELKSVGPIAFGPEGVLFVSDGKAATIYAIQADAAKGEPAKAKHDVKQVAEAISKTLDKDAKPGQVRIVDLAVNPDTGNIVFAVTAGSDSTPALVARQDQAIVDRHRRCAQKRARRPSRRSARQHRDRHRVYRREADRVGLVGRAGFVGGS
jgi:hypothetical protein